MPPTLHQLCVLLANSTTWDYTFWQDWLLKWAPKVDAKWVQLSILYWVNHAVYVRPDDMEHAAQVSGAIAHLNGL